MKTLKATASALALLGVTAVSIGCGRVSDEARPRRPSSPSPTGAGHADPGPAPRGDGGTESPGSPRVGSPTGDAGDDSLGAPPSDASTPVVVSPPKVTLIDRLADLHFELDIEAIAPPGCHSVFKLNWNGDGIAGSDAIETRIFDAAGRLVAAELASTKASVRRRVKVTYDSASRGIEYLFGTRGTGTLEPLIPENAAATDDQTLGTVVAAERGADGSITARVASDEQGLPSLVESVVFGKGGRFESRTRNNGTASFVETVSYDSEGRPSVHRFDHPTWGPEWGSPIEFTYADRTTFATFTEGIQQLFQHRISFHYDGAGRPVETDFDADGDGKPDEKATFTVSADGLTSTETTDVGLDGIADIITEITSGPDGSLLRGTERNMLEGGLSTPSPSFPSAYGDNKAYRQLTPLCAYAQGQAAMAFEYDLDGRLLSANSSLKKYRKNVLELVSSDSLACDYSGEQPVARRALGDWELAGYKVQEDSSSECTLSTTCNQTIPWSAPSVRCELGLALRLVPDVYSSLPGFETMMRCWAPLPLSSNFLTYYPNSQRDILGY